MREGRLIVLSILVGIGLLSYGIKAYREADALPTATTLTYSQFVQQHPTKGWYHITNCYLDTTSAMDYKKDGFHQYYMVALRGMSTGQNDSVHVMVVPGSRDVVDTVDKLFKLQHSAEQADTVSAYQNGSFPNSSAGQSEAGNNKRAAEDAWIAANPSKVYVKTDVVGMIPNNLHEGPSPNATREGDTSGIDGNFIVVDETSAPSKWLAIGAMAGGAVMLVGLLFSLVSGRRTSFVG